MAKTIRYFFRFTMTFCICTLDTKKYKNIVILFGIHVKYVHKVYLITILIEKLICKVCTISDVYEYHAACCVGDSSEGLGS